MMGEVEEEEELEDAAREDSRQLVMEGEWLSSGMEAPSSPSP